MQDEEGLYLSTNQHPSSENGRLYGSYWIQECSQSWPSDSCELHPHPDSTASFGWMVMWDSSQVAKLRFRVQGYVLTWPAYDIIKSSAGSQFLKFRGNHLDSWVPQGELRSKVLYGLLLAGSGSPSTYFSNRGKHNKWTAKLFSFSFNHIQTDYHLSTGQIFRALERCQHCPCHWWQHCSHTSRHQGEVWVCSQDM